MLKCKCQNVSVTMFLRSSPRRTRWAATGLGTAIQTRIVEKRFENPLPWFLRGLFQFFNISNIHKNTLCLVHFKSYSCPNYSFLPEKWWGRFPLCIKDPCWCFLNLIFLHLESCWLVVQPSQAVCLALSCLVTDFDFDATCFLLVPSFKLAQDNCNDCKVYDEEFQQIWLLCHCFSPLAEVNLKFSRL